MTTAIQIPPRPAIEYPEDDGKPMVENTLQYRWIVTIKEGVEIQFDGDPDVFVAADLLWYPVEGNNEIRTAPDIMIVFGRPKGDRGSYKQWQEGGVPVTVVFEVLSPGNTVPEMADKFAFYEDHGVEEYYIYDPDFHTLEGWLRENGTLKPIEAMNGWVSPRLGIRFGLSDDGLQLYRPDGQPFLTELELDRQADEWRQRADDEKRRADEQQDRANAESRRAERLAAQLKALRIEPEP